MIITFVLGDIANGISILSLLLPNWLGGMVYLLNLLGSTGDLYMGLMLMKFSSSSKIVDKKYGFNE